MYRFSEKHISKADPSFHERLLNALESSELLSVKIDTTSLNKKKFRRYKNGITIKELAMSKE